MTSFARSRCAHCQVAYHYQASGWGADKYDNNKYCPTCFKAIQDALGAIPKVTRHEYRAVRDKTVEELVEIERLRQKAWREKNPDAIPIRRIFAPLFDLHDPSNNYHSGEVTVDGCTYHYRYWSKQGMEKGIVEIHVAVDIASGEILGPWDVKTHWKTPPQFYVPEPEPDRGPPPRIDLLPYRMPITRMIDDQSQSIESAKTLTYPAIGRKTFSLEPLPEGALPIYDTDPDVTAFVVGEEDDSK